jgi:hypothetical protein
MKKENTMKSFVWQQKNWFIALSLLCLLALSLAACGSTRSGNGSSKPPSTAGSGNVTRTVPAVSTPTVNANPGSAKDPCTDLSYWKSSVGLHRGQTVESVSCGNLIGTADRQAVVAVRNAGDEKLLDVHVYRTISSAHPEELFKLAGLVQGNARVSRVNTVITAEVDKHSSINQGKSAGQLIQDLFREFKWSAGAGTLVQTVFAGFYPDLTRYQAEAVQEAVNQGHQPWRLDAVQIAKLFATSILNMQSSSSVTVVSGGGPHDLNAVVHVTLPPEGSTSHPVKLTLSRLEANSNGGIWEVTAVASENMAITSPRSHERLDSPVTVTGAGMAFEGQIGGVRVLDHLYYDIGSAFAMSQNANSGFGPGTFSTPVKYNASFQGGSQEGILALYHQGGAQSDFGVTMVKVLVEA